MSTADLDRLHHAIDPNAVRRAAEIYFQPTKMNVVLVGEARPLTIAVERSGLPSASVVKPD